ncbi:MAG TPA: glycoside hydrolase family 3 N-terminal domain-containing protein, partial [Patescibacteria group bacterium]|nr:glycoside hydrolase family 3 N-terminal domain-containing protein [Patescibacteria group bacterium]
MTTDARDLGQLLFVGFDGTGMTVELRSFLREIRPGGIILFKRNIVEPRQTLDLIAELHALCEPAPIIAVDEEGGQVSRLRPLAPTLPPAAKIAARGDLDAARRL